MLVFQLQKLGVWLSAGRLYKAGRWERKGVLWENGHLFSQAQWGERHGCIWLTARQRSFSGRPRNSTRAPEGDGLSPRSAKWKCIQGQRERKVVRADLYSVMISWYLHLICTHNSLYANELRPHFDQAIIKVCSRITSCAKLLPAQSYFMSNTHNSNPKADTWLTLK